MNDVPAPVSLLVSVSVDREIVVVDLGVVDVTVHVDLIKNLRVGLVLAEASHLTPNPDADQEIVGNRDRAVMRPVKPPPTAGQHACRGRTARTTD